MCCVSPYNVPNTMGQSEGDFEKGESDGTADALNVLATVIPALASEIGLAKT